MTDLTDTHTWAVFGPYWALAANRSSTGEPDGEPDLTPVLWAKTAQQFIEKYTGAKFRYPPPLRHHDIASLWDSGQIHELDTHQSVANHLNQWVDSVIRQWLDRGDQIEPDDAWWETCDPDPRSDMPINQWMTDTRSAARARWAANQIALNEYAGRDEHLFDPQTVTPETSINTVRECMRIRSTVPGFTRVATKPMNIGGIDVAKDELVFCIVWSANLDPKAYDNPEQFLPQRWDNPATPEHVTFGLGNHRCIGKHLALAEQAAFLAATAKYDYTLPSTFVATSDQPLRPGNLIVT